MVKRKSPCKHKVSAHIRSGTPIRSFTRGSGVPMPAPSPGRRRRVGATKVVRHDLLTGVTTINVVKPRHPYTGKPYRGIGKPRRPKTLPDFPPTSLLPPSEPPTPGPYLPMPILAPDPIPVPPGAIRRRHGGWVKYDVKTGGVTTYIPGTRSQPGTVTHTPDPSKRVPFDPSIKYEPVPIPTPIPMPKGYRRRRQYTPGRIVKSSNQLLARYKRTKLIPEKIDIFNQLKALSDEHMRLTGKPTTIYNIQPTDLFTKKQLEAYSQRMRR